MKSEFDNIIDVECEVNELCSNIALKRDKALRNKQSD